MAMSTTTTIIIPLITEYRTVIFDNSSHRDDNTYATRFPSPKALILLLLVTRTIHCFPRKTECNLLRCLGTVTSGATLSFGVGLMKVACPHSPVPDVRPKMN